MKIRPIIVGMISLGVAVSLYAQEHTIDKIPDGFIPKQRLPNSLKIIHQAPQPGSPRQQLDDAVAAAARKLNTTPRFALAAKDATMRFPEAVNNFACATGKVISKEKTPHLFKLMILSGIDAGLSTYKAKKSYQRIRPFMLNNAPICTPKWQEKLKHNGSYPSGHSARGWAWALILAELLPQRADAILARGRAYGESRIICNVHWYSDVLAGRTIGASAVALMHDNPKFIEGMKAAKEELAKAPAPDAKMCEKEAEILSRFPLF